MSGTDSTGVPWSGRSLTGTGFDDDTGAADPALLAALAAVREDPSADSDRRLVAAAAGARWLVPVVAVLDDTPEDGGLGGGEHGHPVDKRTDMALVTLTAPDGRRALPLFSSTAALAAWDPAARPVPVPAARAAQAAVAEGCQVAVVDLADPHPVELRPSMLWALAQQRDWEPAHTDPFVTGAVERAVVGEPDVAGHRLEEGTPTGQGRLRCVLVVRPGLSAEGLTELATRIGERLATDGELRARVDELTFAVEAAG